MGNKLELTWYGKDKPINVEPRVLIENPNLSNISKDPNTQNMLIHGDNLLALKALEAKFAGKINASTSILHIIQEMHLIIMTII